MYYKTILSIMVIGVITISCNQSKNHKELSNTDFSLDRTILPISGPKQSSFDELDARNAKAPTPFEIKAPKNAPNVVIVMLDDVGFGQPSTFGGPISTPTADKLSEAGLKYNRFCVFRKVAHAAFDAFVARRCR